MRYFLNTSAARPIVAGGITFTFEPVGLRGGSWLGILAVADNAAASILAESHSPNVEEIPFATYDGIKKKLTLGGSRISALPILPNPVHNPALAVAARAGLPIAQATANPPTQNSTEMITPVTLLTTRNQPPVEPLLAAGASMKRPR